MWHDTFEMHSFQLNKILPKHCKNIWINIVKKEYAADYNSFNSMLE